MADRVMHVEFIVLAFIGLLLPIFAPSNNRRVGRRLFWGGLSLATVSAFFIAYPPDWRTGIGLSLLCIIVMVITAYFNSPFIKIRGKIYAISIEDSRPDPAPDGTSRNEDVPDPAIGSYGGAITLQKFWWLLVFLTGMCSFGVVGYLVDKDSPRVAMVTAAMLVAMATLAGYLDASEAYPIARGQRVQFAIISIITVGAFTVVYFAAYQAGNRWPLRRKQSQGYRGHPRHSKE